VLQSPPTHASFASGALERAQAREQGARGRGGPARTTSVQRELVRRLSLAVAYDLWLDSWETALSALATATQSRTLSTNDAAAHKAVIAAERELVTTQFTLLLGHHPTRRGAEHGLTFVAVEDGTFMEPSARW
jgi:hypothetical protein